MNLAYKGQRVENTNITLGELVEHAHAAHFSLVVPIEWWRLP